MNRPRPEWKDVKEANWLPQGEKETEMCAGRKKDMFAMECYEG